MAAQGPVVGVVCVKKIRKGTEYAPQSASMHFGQVQTCLSLVFKDFLRKIAFLARNQARSGPKSGWNPRYEHQWKLNSIPGHYQSFEMNYMGNGWFSNEKNAKFGPKPLFRARLGGLARFWARNLVFSGVFALTSFEHLI